MLLLKSLCILSVIRITYERHTDPGAPCPNYSRGACTYPEQCPASNQHSHCTVSGTNKVLKYYTAREFPDRTQCGRSGFLYDIFNANKTEIGEYPWMAALLYVATKNKTYDGVRCAGTLITEKFVLTAAHCVKGQTPESIRVLLGDWNITTNPDFYISRKCRKCNVTMEHAPNVINATIDKIISHEHYKTRRRDIALLRLETPVAFTDYVRPVCLPSKDFPLLKMNDDLFVAGWGATGISNDPSDVLLKARVNPLAADACADKIHITKKIHKTELCAFNLNSEACGGDSGGPLIKIYKRNWFQLGIVESGYRCPMPTATIFTRVSSFVNWIIGHITPEAERNSRCKISDKKNGKCVLVSECPVLEQQYLQPNSSEVELVRRSLCGFDGVYRSDLVCCRGSAIKRGNAMEGSSCKTPKAKRIDGKCVRITNCPVLKNASKAGYEPILKSQCGFDDELLVCCKMQNIVVASKPKYLEEFPTANIPDRTICGPIRNDSAKGEYPWLAALMYRQNSLKKYYLKCGGSLINTRFVLTAASCLKVGLIANYRVLIGTPTGLIDQYSNCHAKARCDPHMQNLTVEEAIVHPFYYPRYSLNNIALVRLESDVKFDDYVRPVCLPPPNLQPLRTGSTRKVIVAGWGRLSNSDRPGVHTIVNVKTGLWDAHICVKNSDLKTVHKQEFCTPTNDSMPFCLTVLGGPIMRAHKDKRGQNLFLEGIYLGSLNCKRRALHNSNVRISAYTSWIVGTIANTRNTGY